MIFIYVFYIDLFLEQNFFMNFIVLALSYTLCRCSVRFAYLRQILAALCGAIANVLLLLYTPGYGWAVWGMILLVLPSMLLVSFGLNGWRDFWIRFLISWFAIILLNGVAEALQNLAGIRSLTFYGAILVLMITRLLVQAARSSARRQERLYPVTLYHGAQRADCLGLYDTGNLLEMADGGPVHIVSPGLIGKLKLEEGGEFTMIPFQTLGTGEGWIRVMKIEKMRIGSGKHARELSDVWLGRAQPELFQGKCYQMILNGAKGVIT